MNNSTFGDVSVLPAYKNLYPAWVGISSLISPILQLPLSIYILHLIIARHLITSEILTLNLVICEIFICFYDFFVLPILIWPNTHLTKLLTRFRMFCLGFILTGRPCLLALVCVERYLAVRRPVLYLRFKTSKYKLVPIGLTWLGTLVSCLSRFFTSFSVYLNTVVVQICLCCVLKLYCCISSLQVLKQPGPGEGERQRVGMSRAKLKAFWAIIIITIFFIIMYLPLVTVIFFKEYFTFEIRVNLMSICHTLTAVSGYVQTFLFLKKMGKLPFMKKSS